MENEYIVLIKFNTIKEGLSYFKDKGLELAFIVGNKTYNYLGKEITIDGDKQTFLPSEIYLEIAPKSIAGMLYVENNLLKYFKEI